MTPTRVAARPGPMTGCLYCFEIGDADFDLLKYYHFPQLHLHSVESRVFVADIYHGHTQIVILCCIDKFDFKATFSINRVDSISF